MYTFYVFCAVFGCFFILIQFVMAIFAGVGADADFDGGDASGSFDDASAGDASDGGGDDASGEGAHGGGHGSAISLLKMLSIRTVSAGIGFFGLAGLAADAAQVRPGITLGVAAVAGIAASILVYFLYRLISSFRYNGAITEASLPGCSGTVHVRIPPNRAASGKVLVTQQERLMEYEAVTDAAETLAAGTPIIVREVLSTTLILVAPMERK